MRRCLKQVSLTIAATIHTGGASQRDNDGSAPSRSYLSSVATLPSSVNLWLSIRLPSILCGQKSVSMLQVQGEADA